MWLLLIVGAIVLEYYFTKRRHRFDNMPPMEDQPISTPPSPPEDDPRLLHPLSLKLKNSPFYSDYPTTFECIMYSDQKTEQKIDFLLESLRMGHELEEKGSYVCQSIEEDLPYYCETEREYDDIKYGRFDIPPLLVFPDKNKPPKYILDGIIEMLMFYHSGESEHPSKFRFWKGKIIQMAMSGDLQAIACVSCTEHYTKAYFTDEDRALFQQAYTNKILDTTKTDPEAALAYARWVLWDDRSDEYEECLKYAATQGNSSDAWYWLAKLYSSKQGVFVERRIDEHHTESEWVSVPEEEKTVLANNERQCYLCGAQSDIGVMKGLCQYRLARMIEDENPDMAQYLYAQAHENGVH